MRVTKLKVCRKCGIEKPLTEFHKAPRYKDGVFSRCKECANAIRRKAPSYNSAPFKDRPKELRAHKLKYKYGLTPEQYDAMAAQNGACAICGLRTAQILGVDHDHTTGKVRALLCHHCNAALGLLRDNPELIRKAAEYLEKYH